MPAPFEGVRDNKALYDSYPGSNLRFFPMPKMLRTSRQRSLIRILIVLVVFLLVIATLSSKHKKSSKVRNKNWPALYLTETDPTPLVNKYIDNGPGGDLARWYIPEEWLPSSGGANPQNGVEAAQLALQLAVRDGRYVENTNIPLIVHSDWKSLESSGWSLIDKQCVETWLEAATGSLFPETTDKFTYILWRHEAIDWFIEKYEPELWPYYQRLPAEVEKSDVFRVLVLKWFGGVYGDVDTQPLKHPKFWAKKSDVAPWQSKDDGLSYGLGEPREKPYTVPPTVANQPLVEASSSGGPKPSSYKAIMENYSSPAGTHLVGAMLGIECDIDPKRDRWWRIGYDYPIQLTNWALALAPQHPFAIEYLKFIQHNMDRFDAGLSDVSPLQLTGPPAFTNMIRHFAETRTVSLEGGHTHFDFNSLTGRYDPPGSRGKVVAGDTMILPITGYSPGRGWKDNMGALPASHAEARLYHFFAGSWRKHSIAIELRKFCRLALGMCRKPTSVPSHPWNDWSELKK